MILLELFILLELIRLFRHSLYYAHFVASTTFFLNKRFDLIGLI